MTNVQQDRTDVKSTIDELDAIVRLQQELSRQITREHAEALLHWDQEVGSFCNGDVEVWGPEQWPLWTDNHYWTPSQPDETEREIVEAEQATIAEIADLDLLESTREYLLCVEMAELEWRGTREEYEAWLDSMEPTLGELEARDLSDCGFGHVA